MALIQSNVKYFMFDVVRHSTDVIEVEYLIKSPVDFNAFLLYC